MDNLDNWLYIVIMIIAGISGLLSSGKKKKRQEEVQRQPETNQTPESYDWETDTLEWETETPEWEPETRRQKTPIAPPPQKMPVYTPLFNEEGERTTGHPQAEEIPVAESRITISEENFRDADELKKAILYSEILNRKY